VLFVQGSQQPAEVVPLNLAPQENVGAHAQVARQRQILVDRLDPHVAGVGWPGNMHRPPIKENLALIGLVNSGDDLDQRGLAGAVIPDQPDDLAGVDIHTHVVNCGQAAEALDNVPHREQRFHSVIPPPHGR